MSSPSSKRICRPKYPQLREEARRLTGEGYSLRLIADELEKSFGKRLSINTIVDWVRGVPRPPVKKTKKKSKRPVKVEDLRPSKDLSYVVSSVLGDGYVRMWRSKRGYVEKKVMLAVADHDYVQGFAVSIGHVLVRSPPPIRKYIQHGRPIYHVSVNSVALFELLKDKDLNKLRPFIELSTETKIAFLQGLYDAEGTVSGEVRIHNTNRELLEYAKALLEEFGIRTSRIYITSRVGDVHEWNGRKIIALKDCYAFSIDRFDDILKFRELIGFNIKRKQEMLDQLIEIRLEKRPWYLKPSLVLQIYEFAVELRKRGLPFNRIAAEVEKKFGVKPTSSTIWRW
ncbi:MAG: LAGLIDADG family homing endonuclease [Candidatus Caldarchaeales archaeon]